MQAQSRAGRPIVADLRAAGLEVDSVWDVIESPDPAAVPILMDHLDRGRYPAFITESLGQALGTDKHSLILWDRLKNRFLNARTETEEGAAALALSMLATRDQLDDLIEPLAVENRGDSRVYFIRPILKLGRGGE